MAPGLYLVATPIGNLRDITLRALDVLRAADVILCEDTRVSAKLLTSYGISRPTYAYHDHNAVRVLPKILERLQAGAVVAQITDAGTPLVSDPGFRLVQAATEAGIMVTTVPGASAPVAALTLAALPSDRFLFAGFPPAKTGARRKFYEEFRTVPATLVFFESPHRLPESLADAASVFGDRGAAVCRELTKKFEEVRRLPLQDLAQSYGPDDSIKGEIVLVIGPPGEALPPEDSHVEALLLAALKTQSVKEAATVVAAITGLPKRDLYTHALKLKDQLP
ncbi:16S rRNA (cytidine(1402)-2'-O)-methyltransferase [Govanella unica]|uniref:Ribosomal RNA small subunit methyltransferase I n=1 Tax=Govanella unica TaxID=2975056 RepID=A0A9X3TZK0_9PROT|nr:16S rRNA (cytidine(1402)-2'-O)-methyltransferase [Govania unica]MDA5194650.1 16S rRNA (cytidine(1402)-2'-O)-methyltransferase [Govania unica]